MDRRDATRRRLERVFLVHEGALRYNAGDVKLERRCVDLALELGRYSDALRHLSRLLEAGGPTDAERAELEDLAGQCEAGMARYEEAERRFLRALGHDPRRVACYERLARLRRVELRRIEAADGTIREMVVKNPKSGLAYIGRWRYARDFSPPADAKDIEKGLELAPDDPEVLLAAALAADQRGDMASVRTCLDKGFKLAPRNAAFALSLSRVERVKGTRIGPRPSCGGAFEIQPTAALAFELAENLLTQGRVDGKDGANIYMTLLRNAGMGDTLVRFLEAEVPFQQKRWREAIPRLEMARAVLASSRELVVRLNLMLAECHGQLGLEEQRLDDLRRAAEGGRDAETARIELAQALSRSGKLDQAVMALLPLAERKPEWRLDLVRLLLQRAKRQPRALRNWPEVERYLRETEKALPQAGEELALIHLEMLVAKERLEDARSLLSALLIKDPRNLRYRLASARLAQLWRQDRELRQGASRSQPTGMTGLQVIDQAEKDLGPSLDIQLARLDYWGLEGGDAGRAAVAGLSAARQQVSEADRPAYLDRLEATEIRLGELDLARQHGRELAALQPENLVVRLGLFHLAMAAGDHGDAGDLVGQIRKIEGDEGTSWRFARAALLIDAVRRGAPEHLDEARRLASEIFGRRPEWSGAYALEGELAELAGSPDQAITSYLRAVERGEVPLSLTRRLVGLLAQGNRFDEIDRVTRMLRDQGAALDAIAIVEALGAIRKRDYDRGVALARQAFPDTFDKLRRSPHPRPDLPGCRPSRRSRQAIP